MNVGVLIFFAVVGAVICAKSRVPAGAVVFSVIAVVLFIGTPMGAGMPGILSDFLSTVSQASKPFTGGSGAVG